METEVDMDPRSFNQRLTDAGITTIYTGEHDRIGRQVIYLEFGGEADSTARSTRCH